MLKVIVREMKLQKQMLLRPLVAYNRRKSFPVHEASGPSVTSPELTNFGFNHNDADIYQNCKGLQNFVNFKKSKGNYVVDADGNTMLDVAGTELNPLGYNHDLFKGVISSKEVDNSIINNFAADAGTSANFAALVKESLASVAPKGMNGVALSNMKNATGEAVAHAMIDRSMEWSGMSALYFQGSTHGSPLTLGGMICGFPSAPYPASKSDESSILEQVRNTVADKRSNNTPVAAIVIEPTQYSTGYVASEEFIGSLKSIASEFEAALIVDETATGCGASGKGFWQYQGDADFVAFGKRMQATGYFTKEDGLKLAGNENDVNLFKVVKQAMQEDSLLTQVSEVSQKLSSDSQKLSSLSGVTGVRSSGTSLWLDTDNTDTSSKLLSHLRSHGVLAKLNGSRGIVARPALIFGPQQCNELVNTLLQFK